MHRINNRTATIALATIVCSAAVAIPSARARSNPALAIASRSLVAQDDTDTGEDSEVPPAQVDKYIDINLAMQKDHGLTVEQAASKHGMTVAQFRTLEDKIERDDTLRERVRTALRKAANPKATDSDSDQ